MSNPDSNIIPSGSSTDSPYNVVPNNGPQFAPHDSNNNHVSNVPVPYQPYPQQYRAPVNSNALIAFVLGVSAFLVVLTAPIAIYCGHKALRELKEPYRREQGQELAVIGLVFGYLMTLMLMFFLSFMAVYFASFFVVLATFFTAS